MTGTFQVTRISIAVLFAVCCLATNGLQAQQGETTPFATPQHLDRLALLGEVYIPAPSEAAPSTPVKNNEPVPFKISTMAGDLVPPFPSHPELTLAKPSPAKYSAEKPAVSFKENMPVEPKVVESVDDCCRELSEMIAGNLESDIDLATKKRMIDTALKMVARNVALKAEAKITKLKADHALEMARVQAQMGQMRSMRSATDQINRVAGPLSQILQRNYQQAVTMNLANQQLSQTMAQLGFNRLEEEAAIARANRERIQLSSPPAPQISEADSKWQIAQLTEQLSRLQQQLESKQSPKPYDRTASNIQRAGYNQPLQPRRQPLEPMPRYQSNAFYDGYQYPSANQWRSSK